MNLHQLHNYPKPAIIIISVITILGLLTVVFSWKSIAPRLGLAQPISQPNPSPPAFTGYQDEPLPEDLVISVKQASDLRNLVPVTTSDFTLDYDYKLGHFTVLLNPPHPNSTTQFWNWIQQNNYSQIPQSEFTLTNQ